MSKNRHSIQTINRTFHELISYISKSYLLLEINYGPTNLTALFYFQTSTRSDIKTILVFTPYNQLVHLQTTRSSKRLFYSFTDFNEKFQS